MNNQDPDHQSADPPADQLCGNISALLDQFVREQGGVVHLGRLLGILDLVATQVRAKYLENQGFMRVAIPAKDHENE
jgi:hypothetical protein